MTVATFQKIWYRQKYWKISIYLTKTSTNDDSVTPTIGDLQIRVHDLVWECFLSLTKRVEIGLSITIFKLSIERSKLARHRK